MKKKNKGVSADVRKEVFRAWLSGYRIETKTSQDIVDELSFTYSLTVGYVTEQMMEYGYHLEYEDDRLVWKS